MSPEPVPLILGVTGHRDLRPDDLPALEARVREVFEGVAGRVPHTPLVVLSALAEGADRLVARVALERGARLVAVLPMRPDVYEEAFADEASVAEFRELLGRSDPVLDLARGRVAIPPGASQAARESGYDLAGAYVARYSQVLIALWDGVAHPRCGATAQVVTYALGALPEALRERLLGPRRGPEADPLDPPERSGAVLHVPTPRLSNPEPPCGPPTSVRTLVRPGVLDEADVRARFERTLQALDAYNADAARAGADADRHAPAPLLGPDDRSPTTPELDAIRHAFETADALSVDFRRRASRARLALFLLVFLAASAFAAAPLAGTSGLVGLTLLAVALAVSAAAVGRRAGRTRGAARHPAARDFWNRHLDARALAEALRVQFYWRLAGMDERVEDHYLRHHRTELDWVLIALRNLRLVRDGYRVDPPAPGHPAREAELYTVHDRWVEGQRAYFTRAAGRYAAVLARSWRLVYALLLVGVAAAVLSVAVPASVRNPLRLAAVLTPAAAVLVLLHAAAFALPEKSERAERMGVAFATARDRLGEALRADDPSGALRVLRAVGCRALAESGQWLMLRRDRPRLVPPR